MSYRYLAIDFGESYVGFAVSNGILARPLEVFKYPQANYKILQKHLFKIIEKNAPSVIIVGIPLSSPNSSLKIKEIFNDFLFDKSGWKEKLIWFDEDYSTKEAILLKKKKRMREDSIAASIVLEKYLESIRFN
ncbi:MAG: Putative pre-16S rRNA nuclease [Mycoplasmataceae bacterium]|nr:MAG: Putative pre-16S rRNA nuclease [Mycoplasmataceae bacterium]